MRRLLIFCLFAAVVAQPALAKPAAAPEPARIAAAEKLLAAMHYDSLIDRSIDLMIVEQRKAMPAQLRLWFKEQPLPDDLVAKMQAISEAHMRKTFSDNRAELKHGTVLIYAAHFTAAELNRLAKLQSDPVMAKMQAEMPQITADSLALGQAAALKDMPVLIAELKALVQDYVAGKSGKPST